MLPILICTRNLSKAEPKFKILTLGRYYHNKLPKAGTSIQFVDQNGHYQGTGKIHRTAEGRIGRLSWWYRQNRHVIAGSPVSIYEVADGNYMLKSSSETSALPEGESSIDKCNGDNEDSFSRLLEEDLENYLRNNIEYLEK